jgi:hypothetical protein
VIIVLAAKTRLVEDLIEVIDAGATDIQRDWQIEAQSVDAQGASRDIVLGAVGPGHAA